ncbi:DUF6660 family protein [Zunongwangia sp. HGR-M22]|uniref:DUF6660 family protein n=1 Tax=Zunongwangia sp. HGR-M22 TaxID=3015168 RepID=UPI0022DE1D0B|nr:DUF6660 family protein [Zunongwangia sp. HGR-M22]WBL26566.1 hypothetical protein PBT91_04675 [Zunongwangia sp. HGR-M22]
MKIVVLITSILVIILSIIPCCSFKIDRNDEICVNSLETEEDDHNACDEPCSPFFNCGSCTGFAIQQNLEINFIQDDVEIIDIISYQNSLTNSYQYSAFKPPKV